MKVKMQLKDVLTEANEIGKVKEVLSQQLGGLWRELFERSRSGIHTWGWVITCYKYRERYLVPYILVGIIND